MRSPVLPVPRSVLLLASLGVSASFACSDDSSSDDTLFIPGLTTETGNPTTDSGDGDGDSGDGDGDPATASGDGDGDATESGDGDGDATESGDGDGDEPPPECGNGIVEAGEACDDGNDIDDDECTNECQFPNCGDGIVQDGEECDVGNETMFCDGDCTYAMCGDGYHNMLSEQCDDGNSENNDECVGACQLNVCGDTYVYEGVEECDDGNLEDDDDCTSACVAAFCGDGIVHAQDEECDDANMIDTDACTAGCTAAACGDGVIWEGMETCDDGNLDDGDACPSSCEPAFCGDGFVQLGIEECDDGNDVDDDSCTNDCIALVFGVTIGGSNFNELQNAMDVLGLIYDVEDTQWLQPNSAQILIMSNDGGNGDGPDYSAHLAAGNHVLIIGGSSLQAYRDYVAGYFTITNPGGWHQSNDCMQDWNKGAPHPITSMMPDTYEFGNVSSSYHMLHFNTDGQPANTTVLGTVCHGAPTNQILITRSYVGGGTMTYMGFDVGNYADNASTNDFMAPFLQGYLNYVDSL